MESTSKSKTKAQLLEEIEALKKQNERLKLSDASRKRLEQAMEEGKKIYKALIELSPEAIILHINGKIVYANQTAIELFGYKSITDFIDKNMIDLVPEEIKEAVEERIRRSSAGEKLASMSFRTTRQDGREFYLEAMSACITSGDSTIVQVLIRDVTSERKAEQELHRLNRALKAISEVNHLLIRADDEKTFLEEVCRIICETGGYLMAWVGYALHDKDKTVEPVVVKGIEEDYLKRIKVSWDDVEIGQGPMGTAIRTGKTSVVQDLEKVLKYPSWRKEALQRNFKSILGLPLKSENETYGALGIYSSREDAFDKEETKLLEQLAADLSYGVTTIRLRIEQEKAQQALRESEHRYRMIYDNDMSGDFIIKADGTILSCNAAFVRIFGFKNEEDALKYNYALFYKEKEKFDSLIKRVCEEKVINRDEELFVRPDKKNIHIVQNLICTFDDNGDLVDIKGYLFDDTERLKAEEELKESEARYRSLVELSPEAIIVHQKENDHDLSKIIYTNAAALKIFGLERPEQMIGKTFMDIIPEEHKEMINKKIQAGTYKLPLSEPIQLAFEKPGHQPEYFEAIGAPIKYKGHNAAQIIIRNITAAKLYEAELQNSREQLRNLAAHLQAAREEERTHVAREIHDELGQNLTGLKMDISFLHELVEEKVQQEDKNVILDKINSTSKLLDSTVKTVRKISSDLRPAVLDSLGLLPAIEWLTEEFQQRMGIECECFITVESVSLPVNHQTTFFRILQESLTNVMRHANATRVSVEFGKDNENYVLTVKDNGKGINTADFEKNNSFGLIGIRERAHLFGGEAEINGEAGKGTTITVRIPEVNTMAELEK